MSCGYVHQETHRERCIRQYKMAVQVMEQMKKQGELDEICKVKAIEIPLFKNISCRVWGNGEIDYGYGKQARKIPEGTVVINI